MDQELVNPFPLWVAACQWHLYYVLAHGNQPGLMSYSSLNIPLVALRKCKEGWIAMAHMQFPKYPFERSRSHQHVLSNIAVLNLSFCWYIACIYSEWASPCGSGTEYAYLDALFDHDCGAFMGAWGYICDWGISFGHDPTNNDGTIRDEC